MRTFLAILAGLLTLVSLVLLTLWWAVAQDENEKGYWTPDARPYGILFIVSVALTLLCLLLAIRRWRE